MPERTEINATPSLPGDTPPLMLYIANESGHGIYSNLPLLKFFGIVESKDVLGAGWVDWVHADDRQAVLEHMVAALCTRKPYTMEYRVRLDPDSYAWVRDLGLPYCNAAGDFQGYVGLLFALSASDFGTDKPHAARCLLGEHAYVPILHRFDGTITYWGEAATALYGWTSGEAQGRKLDDLIYSQESNQLAETRNTLSEHNEWSGSLTHQTKEGRSLPVQVRSTFLSNNQTMPLAARDLISVICPQ